jgi:hypothetical protein
VFDVHVLQNLMAPDHSKIVALLLDAVEHSGADQQPQLSSVPPGLQNNSHVVIEPEKGSLLKGGQGSDEDEDSGLNPLGDPNAASAAAVDSMSVDGDNHLMSASTHGHPGMARGDTVLTDLCNRLQSVNGFGVGIGQLLSIEHLQAHPLASERVPIEERGISTKWLNEFFGYLVKADFDGGFDKKKHYTKTTRDFVQEVAAPFSKLGRSVRLFDLVPAAYRGPATVFISHAWDDNFSKLRNAVSYKQNGCQDGFIWLDVFAVAQQQSDAQTTDVSAIAETVRKIGDTKLIVDMWGPSQERGLTPLTRSWCMYEIANTPSGKLDVISPPSVGGLTIPQHEAAGKCCEELSTKDARAIHAEDKEQIDKLMLQAFGSWERADDTIKQLVITSLRSIPVHPGSGGKRRKVDGADPWMGVREHDTDTPLDDIQKGIEPSGEGDKEPPRGTKRAAPAKVSGDPQRMKRSIKGIVNHRERDGQMEYKVRASQLRRPSLAVKPSHADRA